MYQVTGFTEQNNILNCKSAVTDLEPIEEEQLIFYKDGLEAGCSGGPLLIYK